jgi:hypothetical protein
MLVTIVVASFTTSFVHASSIEFVGAHPQASLRYVGNTRNIGALAAWNNKVYAGYGDYNKNTGPIYLTPVDHATGQFVSTPEHAADTEEINHWEIVGDKLYAAHQDPHTHDGADYSVGSITNGITTWSNEKKVAYTHLYDITAGASGPSELFMGGSKDIGSATNEVAKVHRSTDGGQTWTESLSIASRGGYNRIVFVAKLGNKIYAQHYSSTDFSGSSSAYQGWMFNGSKWSKIANFSAMGDMSQGTEYNGRLIYLQLNDLYAFDGRQSSKVADSVRSYAVSGSDIYALVRTDNGEKVIKSQDLQNWQEVTVAPSLASSIAVIDSTLYFGTGEAEIYRVNLSDTATDITGPTVSLITPAAGSVMSLRNELTVNASDISGISKVEYYVGTTLVGTSLHKSGPKPDEFSGNTPGAYTVWWQANNVPAGTYLLTAKAYDTYGNTTTTSPVAITVPEGMYTIDTEAPAVTIVSPNSSTKIGRTTTVYVKAQDNIDYNPMIQVYLDGELIGTTNGAEFARGVTLKKGSHTIYATAVDDAGNQGSASYTFTY